MPRDNIDVSHLILLFIIGLLYHFYGFVLNEYSDIEIDKHAMELSQKPLIKGTINRNDALYAAVIAIFIALGMVIFFFRSIYATGAFLVAILLGGIYDVYGKKFFGADFVLGASIFFFCLFGAYSVSVNLTPVVIIVAFLFFIQLTFQTGVTGGMKDIPSDSLAGAKTTPVYLGCRVLGNELIVTKNFRRYVGGIKVLHTIVVLLPFSIALFKLHDAVVLQLVIILLLLYLMWVTSFKAINLRVFNRLRLMRILGMQEVVTYPIVSVLIVGVIGIKNSIFLIFFPILWLAFFLYIIYGKLMPDV
ncbi:MAG: UbiA prenyltransferase family protein [Thermoplasmata archaeon]|nr:MAG: UbiA prenyltransferase family protein [Thermoplasmata archaeon]